MIIAIEPDPHVCMYVCVCVCVCVCMCVTPAFVTFVFNHKHRLGQLMLKIHKQAQNCYQIDSYAQLTLPSPQHLFVQAEFSTDKRARWLTHSPTHSR